MEKTTTKPQSGTGATWGGCTGATGDNNDLPGIERVTIVGKSDFVRNLKRFQEVWYVSMKRIYVYTVRIRTSFRVTVFEYNAVVFYGT